MTLAITGEPGPWATASIFWPFIPSKAAFSSPNVRS